MAPVSTDAKIEAATNKRLLTFLYTVIGVLFGIIGFFGIDKLGSIGSAIEALAGDMTTLTEETIPAMQRSFTQQLNDLERQVVSLQGDLRSQGSDIDDLDVVLGDHEARLRFLEQWRVNVTNREDGEP